MKYLELKHQVGTEEVGKNIYPQTDGFFGDIFSIANTSYGIFKYNNLPEHFEPKEKIKLANSANKTDFISSGMISGFGFIISDKLKEIFKDHNLVNHRYYNIPIVHRQAELDNYSWIHMYQPNQEFINFDESLFRVRRFSTTIKDDIKFKSMEHFWEERKNYHHSELFDYKKLVIKESNLDLLYIGAGKIKYLISPRLLDALKNNSITGYQTKPLKKIFAE